MFYQAEKGILKTWLKHIMEDLWGLGGGLKMAMHNWEKSDGVCFY